MAIYRNLNALGLLAIAAVLLFAFADQFLKHELPCPLCLLQRIGFVAVSSGLLLNIIFGARPAHYGFAIVSAVAGATVALRQVSLHVIPGTPGYGEPFMGMHFYTWAFVLFAAIILGLAIISSFAQQYAHGQGYLPWRSQSVLCKVAISAFLIVVAANVIAAFAECGPGVCADNPEAYWLLR